MTRDLEYRGEPQLNRARHLREEGVNPDLEHKQDRVLPTEPTRAESTTDLFQNVAKTYLKGEALRKAISRMEPLAFITIEEDADRTITAARRFDQKQSLNGKVITFGMYQRAVDNLSANNWEVRKRYLDLNVPVSPEVHMQEVRKAQSTGKRSKDIISQFLDGLSIAGVMMSFFTGSIFDGQIFGALTPKESGAKVAAQIRVPFGILILLEIGVVAAKVISIYKASNFELPDGLEDLVYELERNPEKRREVFAEAGMDYDEFQQNQEIDDGKTIISYVQDYLQRFGGIINETQTMDHWIAYGTVVANQGALRGALNTADVFSKDFASLRGFTDTSTETSSSGTISSSIEDDPFARIHNAFASSISAVDVSAGALYDDIAQALLYDISDNELCCLIQILGGVVDPEFLRVLASMATAVAIDLSGHLVFLSNIITKILSNLLRDAIYELIAQLNKLLDMVVDKLLKVFDVNIPGMESCIGLFAIGRILIEMAVSIQNKVEALLEEILTSVLDFGLPKAGTWQIAADRKFLVGIAKVLNILALRLDAVKDCAKRVRGPDKVRIVEDSTVVEKAADDIVRHLIEQPSPTLEMSREDLDKYFPGLEPKRSTRFNFLYGTSTVQSNVEGTNLDPNQGCSDAMTDEEIESAKQALRDSIQQVFSTNGNS